MKKRSLFYPVLGLTVVLTFRNLAALLTDHQMSAIHTNLLAVYICGAVLWYVSLYDLVYIPWALMHPERTKGCAVAKKKVEKAGGLHYVTRNGYWEFALSLFLFGMGIYLESHIR